jgi:hypothetical protein
MSKSTTKKSDHDDDEDFDDVLDAPIEPQGTLVELERWVAWRAQLAVLCAELCGCVAFAVDRGDEDVDGDACSIGLVGIAEDAKATRRVYKRMERTVRRKIESECHGQSVAWTSRWAAALIEHLAEEIEGEADDALSRAYRQRAGGGTSIVWEEEGDPEDRAAAARAWLDREWGCDELVVVPEPSPEGVIDLAAFAARQRGAL